jgi:hypothetical protein
VAAPDFVGVAVLVALIATELEEEIVAGAVYRPVAEIVPIEGVMDHVTPALLVPVTGAANCRVWLALKLAVAGVTVIVISGVRVMVAAADFVLSATLVPVMVTGLEAGMVEGAV